MSDTIDLTEFAARRDRVLDALDQHVGLIYAGGHGNALHDDYHADPNFRYLTGITDEPDAVLMLDPANPVEARRVMLFLRPLNPEIEKWDGARLEIASTLRTNTGIKTIFRTDQLPRFLNVAVKRTKSVATLHPLATIAQDPAPDIATFHKLQQRIPGVTITDGSEILPRLRCVKSDAEVAMIERAIDITARGFQHAMSMDLVGANEFDVQAAIEHTYRTNQSRGPAFGTIVGAGFNATVLHYRANNQTIAESDLIVIDTGARFGGFGGYGADITRTLPASGTFTPRQRDIYQTVLDAMEAAISKARPGVTLAELDKLARAVITKAGFGDYFIHSIGHHLGIETHDATPLDEPLRAGAVITIEPGIYLPEEDLGVRIEDDILITKDGARNLSSSIPKTINDIEAAMR